MQKIYHQADSRGRADHGWLLSKHTFSFANYYNPERMGFGLLRVINDDIVQPGMGFGRHPHKNMEIISIPLAGALRHGDSMGNEDVIRAGEVQVMSAGSGITHSEFNASSTEEVRFLQIWVQSKRIDITPRYNQRLFAAEERQNRWQTIVAPDDSPGALGINQDAWFSLANLDSGTELSYQSKKHGNGLYLFVLEGTVSVDNQQLKRRDGLGISGAEKITLTADNQAEVLLIDVPMT
jgi:redox-sensitive bicupin YhaK (pirin superfamily)